jgi:hypothetical protein
MEDGWVGFLFLIHARPFCDGVPDAKHGLLRAVLRQKARQMLATPVLRHAVTGAVVVVSVVRAPMTI